MSVAAADTPPAHVRVRSVVKLPTSSVRAATVTTHDSLGSKLSVPHPSSRSAKPVSSDNTGAVQSTASAEPVFNNVNDARTQIDQYGVGSVRAPTVIPGRRLAASRGGPGSLA